MITVHDHVPQPGGRLFLTDSGLETTLVFHEGISLPFFAAIDLMRNRAGRGTLRRYFERHIAIARAAGAGFVLESPTWRSSQDWCDKLGYASTEMTTLNTCAIALMNELRDIHGSPELPMIVSGNVGPRGDGYTVGSVMTAADARDYHMRQVEAMAAAGADMISAFTMTYENEAIGIARAGGDAGLPVVISFTVETDGRLPSGRGLGEAIDAVDEATAGTVAYYMINCAHPDHFSDALATQEPWLARLGGFRANASRRSHKELDEAQDLDDGNPEELGAQYASLLGRLPGLAVLGGCCGTDVRHVGCIARACFGPRTEHLQPR